MPTSVDLAKSQQLAVEALIGSGSYRTQSEILRSAVDDFMRHIPKSTRMAAAVWAYQNRKATISQAAALADVPHEEMHRTLVREGHFRSGAKAKDIEAEADLLGKTARARSSRNAR
jgi:Arc/MetJ-type ribon-helix-helix transcriptional regulator